MTSFQSMEYRSLISVWNTSVFHEHGSRPGQGAKVGVAIRLGIDGGVVLLFFSASHFWSLAKSSQPLTCRVNGTTTGLMWRTAMRNSGTILSPPT